MLGCVFLRAVFSGRARAPSARESASAKIAGDLCFGGRSRADGGLATAVGARAGDGARAVCWRQGWCVKPLAVESRGGVYGADVVQLVLDPFSGARGRRHFVGAAGV